MEFNTKVDKTTAEDEKNFLLNDVSLYATPATDAVAKLQDDGKTVIITAGTTGGFTTSSFTKDLGYSLTVNDVKNEQGTKTVEKTVKSFVYNDTVVPTLVSVEAKAATTTRSVTVKFDEPVQGIGVYKVNGKNASVSQGTDKSEVTLTTTDTLTAGQSYSLEVTNEKDTEGNLFAETPVTQNFTVLSDTTAQGISNVEVLGDDTLRVSFDEKMDATTLTGTSNIKLLDANGTDIVSRGASVVISATSGDTTGKKFDVKVTGSKSLFNSNKQLSLSLVLTDSVKDSVGNKVTSATQNVTFTLDETKPTITKVEYVKPGVTYDGSARTTGAIVLTFSEDLASAPSLTTSDYKAIKDDGTDETTTVGALTGSFKSNTKNVVILTPATALAGDKTETLRLNADLFTDDSIGANKNEASVQTIDLEKGIAGTDTSKPTVSTVTGIPGSPNTITVQFGEALTGLNGYLDVANYRLDGTALPAGTYITKTAADTVTINLPAGTVKETKNYAFNVINISDKAGNVMNTHAVNTVSLRDDIKPVLTSSKTNADNSITLSYTENVTGALEADFEVYLNGKTTKLPVASYTIADVTSGSDAGASLLKVVYAFEDTDTTPSNGDEKLFIEVDGLAGYTAGDILVVQGTYADSAAATAAYGATTVKLTDLTSIKVKTAASTKGADAASNTVKTGTEITVK